MSEHYLDDEEEPITQRMPMKGPHCPSCLSENIQYVMRATEYFSMASLPDEEGYCDLLALEDSYPDHEFIPYLDCATCHKRFNLDLSDYVE